MCAGRRSEAVAVRPRVGQRTVGVADGQWTGTCRRRRRHGRRPVTGGRSRRRRRRRHAVLSDGQLLPGTRRRRAPASRGHHGAPTSTTLSDRLETAQRPEDRAAAGDESSSRHLRLTAGDVIPFHCSTALAGVVVSSVKNKSSRKNTRFYRATLC